MKYFQTKYPIEIVLSENIEKHFSAHNHIGHYVVALTICGTVEIHRENKKTECFEGDLILIPPYVSHSVYQQKGSMLLSVCIGTSFIKKHSQSESRYIIQMFMESLCEDHIIDAIQKEKIISSLGLIYNSNKSDSIVFEDDIVKLTDRIVRQSERELNLNYLAETAFISKYHLIRKFKKYIGMTPHQFHIQNRVRKAQYLLNDGKSIVETSAEMGFYDQSHFNKSFSKIVGISPSEYIDSRIELNGTK